MNDRVSTESTDMDSAGGKSASPLVIVYHDDMDGVASAFVLAHAMGIKDPEHNPDVKFIEYCHNTFLLHQEEIVDSIGPDSKLYFVDVAPGKLFLDELTSQSDDGRRKLASVDIIDHHASAAMNLSNYKSPYKYDGMPEVRIVIDDNSLSAVNLVWNKEMPSEFEKPECIKILNKMDRVRLKTRNDFSAAAFIDTFPIDDVKKGFASLRGLMTMTFNEMAAKGQDLLTTQESRIDELLSTKVEIAEIEILPGHKAKVPIVNANIVEYGRIFTKKLVELGQKKGDGLACCWYETPNGSIQMSLRSDGNPNTGEIAAHLRKTMGITGGGHKDCAAVQFASLQEFKNKVFADANKPRPNNHHNDLGMAV